MSGGFDQVMALLAMTLRDPQAAAQVVMRYPAPMQARWLASVLAGETKLPPASVMEKEIAAHRESVARQFVGTARYTLEVDARSYAKKLNTDMKTGAAGI